MRRRLGLRGRGGTASADRLARCRWPRRPSRRGGNSGTRPFVAARRADRLAAVGARRDRRNVRVEIAVHDVSSGPPLFSITRTGERRGRFHVRAAARIATADDPPLRSCSAWRARRALLPAPRPRDAARRAGGRADDRSAGRLSDHHQRGPGAAEGPAAGLARALRALGRHLRRAGPGQRRHLRQTYLTAWSGQHLIARLRVRALRAPAQPAARRVRPLASRAN